MIQRHTYHRAATLLAFSWLILTVSARVGGGSSDTTTNTDAASYNPSYNPSYSPYNPYNPNSGNPGAGAGGFNPGFDITQMMDYRRIHGILAATAMVVLFPVGSIIVRVVPGRFAVWVHAGFQMLAWAVYVAAVGMGIYLFENPDTRYHPIIGLVLLVLLIVQPVVGFIHHRVFKKVQKRQVWSYVHLTLGRVGISLGIINGGLGLYLSGASAYHKRVYGIVAGVMWALWMGVAVWSEVRRLRKNRKGTETVVSKGPPAESARVSQE
ncbi:predicted protein [Chaetomium globosum CBS 148.51]|uniref:Cytochrome b561 domain-containing protein n=1 Tax=Chaetomium globosum (strain ATCC 6205 / CBS 148.51 / DSM 1962 / NBRC 6347 / NRRL 1970) TaxID=306901 RepID=Q2H1I6_CHAGB|nr:uncharacterized protein CHGG_04360 [Chaetomium globosum CBS 148.51]EAQ87741.1 predicted protein [Chaetomium globosum CBS 148.51]